MDIRPRTSTIGRAIETTAITIPPVTTTAINFWNWNITLGNVTSTIHILTSSILPPPVTLVDDENPESKTGVSHPPVTRTITVPPFPYEITLTPKDLPTLTFKPWPPGPKCTANCGTKCEGVCSAPCLVDCEGSNPDDFDDPSDPNLPSHKKFSGPDCRTVTMANALALFVFSRAVRAPTALMVSVLVHNAMSLHAQAMTAWMDIASLGLVRAPAVLGRTVLEMVSAMDPIVSPGAVWDQIVLKEHAAARTARWLLVPVQRHNGICTGSEYTPKDNQDECEAKEADSCTEFVGSLSVTGASTYTTAASTQCQSITACSAEATTTTTTRNSPETMTVTDVNSFWDTNSEALRSLSSSLASRQSEEAE